MTLPCDSRDRSGGDPTAPLPPQTSRADVTRHSMIYFLYWLLSYRLSAGTGGKGWLFLTM